MRTRFRARTMAAANASAMVSREGPSSDHASWIGSRYRMR